MLKLTGKILGIKTNSGTSAAGNSWTMTYLGVSCPAAGGFEGEVHTYTLQVPRDFTDANSVAKLNAAIGKTFDIPVRCSAYSGRNGASVQFALVGLDFLKG